MRYLYIIFILLLGHQAPAATLVDLDFNNGSWAPLSKDSWWSYTPNEGTNGTGGMRLFITHAQTAGHPNRSLTFSNNTAGLQDFWIEFDAKVSPHATGGSKFVKFFGKLDSGTVGNNMTMALQYTSMLQNRVSYRGDTLCADTWDGPIAYPSSDCIPHSTYNTTTATGGSIDIRGSAYHHIKMHVKRATQGTRNGTTKIWHNGVLVGDVSDQNTNPYPYGDSTEFQEITFGGYVDPPNFTGADWYMWIDNLYIGTTEKNATPPPGPVLSNPIPTTTLPAGTVSTTLGITTSVNATCKYSLSPGTAYPNMNYFTTGAGTTTHTATINNLVPGQNAPYYVRCAKTSDGEQNDTDYQINIAVANNYSTLTVTKSGTGTGTITSSPSGINCGTVCSESVLQNTVKTLTANPGSDSAFTAWTGCDSVSGNTCTKNNAYSSTANAQFTSRLPILCTEQDFWACNYTECLAINENYWENACRNIPAPDDMIGADLSTNGDFDEWLDGLPVGWISDNTTRITQSYGGVQLDGAGTKICQTFPDFGAFREAINVRSITGTAKLTTLNSTVTFSTPGTKSHVVQDTRVCLEVVSGSIVVDDFVLKRYESTISTETPPAVFRANGKGLNF